MKGDHISNLKYIQKNLEKYNKKNSYIFNNIFYLGLLIIILNYKFYHNLIKMYSMENIINYL